MSHVCEEFVRIIHTCEKYSMNINVQQISNHRVNPLSDGWLDGRTYFSTLHPNYDKSETI